MTAQQIKYVRVLMAQNGLTEQKEEIVLAITDGRTSHLRDLNQEETKALIDSLTGENTKVKTRMVRKVISMAHEMGWELPGGKADMNRIDAWCLKYGSPKKKLDHYTQKELAGVVTAFQKVYVSFLKGL